MGNNIKGSALLKARHDYHNYVHREGGRKKFDLWLKENASRYTLDTSTKK